jgi:hypothetical protein
MVLIWAVLYGLAWFICMIRGLGNQRLLSLCSTDRLGFTPSDSYRRGMELSQLDELGDVTANPTS